MLIDAVARPPQNLREVSISHVCESTETARRSKLCVYKGLYEFSLRTKNRWLKARATGQLAPSLVKAEMLSPLGPLVRTKFLMALELDVERIFSIVRGRPRAGALTTSATT
jgi:hypothetical protein